MQALAGSGSGLAKLSKQIEKLSELTAKISNLTGFEKVTQAANALKSLDNLSGAPNIGSYTKALNKLAQANSSVQAIASFPDITYQLTALSNALNMLRYVQDIKLSSLMNALNMLPTAVQAINNMPDIDAAKVQSLNDALAPLSETNIKQVNSFIRAIDKLPTVAQKLNQLDFTTFSNDIKQFIQTLEPLIQRVQDAAAGLTALAQILQYTRGQTSDSNGLGDLGKKLGNLSLKSLLSWATLIKLKKALTECFEASSQFVENLNLFNVTMGKSAGAAMEFAEKVNDALGIDTSDWVRYQGFFQSIGKGFGVVSNKADLMSQNLTQLAYDISSFYNLSVEEAYNKVQSGFAGELEPLRRLGFALDEATLKQLAYKKGITQTFESMTQAQKAQLRYVAMIEQAQNIGVTGDMSRTIDTAANGVRVLQARIQQFCRAIGNMLMPMLSAVLPYLTAFVQVMTDAANHLAGLFGFELPKIELGNISNGYDDVAAAADDATAATEKFKGSLAGVDQLNIIGSHSNSSGGNGSEISTDLNINLPTYDFLNGVESKTKEIAENMATWFREALPWVEAVATAVGTIFAGIKIAGLITALGKLPELLRNVARVIGTNMTGKLSTFFGALAAGASSAILLYNSIKNLIRGTGNLGNNIAQLAIGLGVAIGVAAAFLKFGNPLGAVITAVVAGIGLIAGAIVGLNDKINDQNEKITDSILYNNGGTKISTIADAYENWADAAIKVNQETIDKYNQLDTYTQQIDGLLDSMDEFANSDFDMTKLTAADAEELKEPFKQLCDYLNDDFQARAQTAADDLKDIFANLGIGGVIEAQVLQGYEKMKQTFNENFTASQLTVSNYLDKISEGGTLSEKQYEEFSKEYSYILDSARNADENYKALDKAISDLENLDLSKVDLESPDEIISALEKIDTAANNYGASALEKYNKEIDNLKVLENQANTDLKYGKIDRSQYDEQMGLINLSKILYAQDYENSIKALDKRTGKIYNSISSAYSKASLAIDPNILDKFAIVVANGAGALFDENYVQSVASGRWLNDNEGYQSLLSGISNLNKLTSNVEFDLMEPQHDTAAYKIYKALETGGTLSTRVVASIETNTAPQNLIYSRAYSEYRDSMNEDTGYASKSIAREINYTAALREPDSKEQNINLFATVECDGDVLGEAVMKYISTDSYAKNGR